MSVVIDVMNADDLSFAAALATTFGWSTSVSAVGAILAHDPDGCFVARVAGRAVATVTTTRYTHGAWIGNLMVSPTSGRIGLGSALLERAIAHLGSRGVDTMWLDADPPGIRIYERHGFSRRVVSRRFLLSGPPACSPSAAEPLVTEDLDEIARVDRPAFGDDRSRLLRLLHDRSEAGFVVRRGGAIAGYALLTACSLGVHLAPWVAADLEAAADLLAAGLARRGSRTLRIGILAPNRAGLRLLQTCGFEESAPSVRMCRGGSGQSGQLDRIFGIASGAVG